MVTIAKKLSQNAELLFDFFVFPIFVISSGVSE